MRLGDNSDSPVLDLVQFIDPLPQGQPERASRVLAMVAQASAEMFGYCTNVGECEAVCPKDIKLEVIARMNRDFLKAVVTPSGEQGMSDAQLYLAIGLPSFVALVGILVNVGYFVALNGRMTRVEDKLDVLTGKVADVNNRVVRIEDKLGIVPR